MKIRTAMYLAVPLALAMTIGLVVASNMGFLINYQLDSSDTGINYISLPYKPAAGLSTVSDLYDDLGGAAAVTSISWRDPATDVLVSYTGGPANDFALIPGQGLVIEMANTVDYKLLGAHDPGVVVNFLGPDDSASGKTLFALPYHAKAGTASELRDEIGLGSVISVARYVQSSGGFETYDGSSSNTDFTLQNGESYLIQVNRTMQYRPKTKF